MKPEVEAALGAFAGEAPAAAGGARLAANAVKQQIVFAFITVPCIGIRHEAIHDTSIGFSRG